MQVTEKYRDSRLDAKDLKGENLSSVGARRDAVQGLGGLGSPCAGLGCGAQGRLLPSTVCPGFVPKLFGLNGSFHNFVGA